MSNPITTLKSMLIGDTLADALADIAMLKTRIESLEDDYEAQLGGAYCYIELLRRIEKLEKARE